MRTFRIRKPSPALVISIVALVAALGGTSYAAFSIPKNSVGTKQLKNGAVTTKKIKNGTVTKSKINTSGLTVPNALHANSADTAGSATNAATVADGAVTTGKIANGAVTTGKIADGAVTTSKLDPSERSQAFQDAETSGTVGPLPNLGSTPATVATLTLPAGGNYAVTAETEFINTDIGGPTSHYADCSLTSNGTGIGDQSATYNAGGLSASGGVTVTGISNGGTVLLVCKADDATHSFAFDRRIVAVRVASVS